MTKFDESGLPEPTKYPQMPKVIKMNERIQELMRQATNPDYDGDDGPANELNIEKFAELIVRECITVIENKMPEFTCKEEYDNLIRKAGRMDAIDEIEQHFGVEE